MKLRNGRRPTKYVEIVIDEKIVNQIAPSQPQQVTTFLISVEIIVQSVLVFVIWTGAQTQGYSRSNFPDPFWPLQESGNHRCQSPGTASRQVSSWIVASRTLRAIWLARTVIESNFDWSDIRERIQSHFEYLKYSAVFKALLSREIFWFIVGVWRVVVFMMMMLGHVHDVHSWM